MADGCGLMLAHVRYKQLPVIDHDLLEMIEDDMAFRLPVGEGQ